MRRISLSVLAGVALLGVTLVLLRAASASLSQPRSSTSAQLVAAAPRGLTPVAPPGLAVARPRLAVARPGPALARPRLAVARPRLAVARPWLAVSPLRPGGRQSGLHQRLARFLAQFLATQSPFAPGPLNAARRSRAITAPPLIGPPRSQGMTCPVATGSGAGGCSIVPCAVYTATAVTTYVAPSPGSGLAILPRVTPRPSAGGVTPAGRCVSRPGTPPRLRWVSSSGR